VDIKKRRFSGSVLSGNKVLGYIPSATKTKTKKKKKDTQSEESVTRCSGRIARGQPGLHSETVSKNKGRARHWWLMPMTLTTGEAEIRRNAFQGQPRQKGHKTPSQPVAGHSGRSVIPLYAGG
jgi:hypothetical protein